MPLDPLLKNQAIIITEHARSKGYACVVVIIHPDNAASVMENVRGESRLVSFADHNDGAPCTMPVAQLVHAAIKECFKGELES